MKTKFGACDKKIYCIKKINESTYSYISAAVDKKDYLGKLVDRGLQDTANYEIYRIGYDRHEGFWDDYRSYKGNLKTEIENFKMKGAFNA